MVRTIDNSTFLFYKVQDGEKIAMHYGVEANDIGLDNHFSRLMCYEGDMLFIRDPITAEPYENDLTPGQLEVKDEEDNTITYIYDELNCEIKQTDSRNNAINIKYDRNNNVVEIKTAENITNKFEYDKESRLTQEIDDENHFINYEYDG